MTNHPRRRRGEEVYPNPDERVPSTIVLAYDVRRAFAAIEAERKIDGGLVVERTWKFGTMRQSMRGVRPNQIIIEKSFFSRNDWMRTWQEVRQRARTAQWELPFLPEEGQDAVYTTWPE